MNALLSPSPTPQIFAVGMLIWANSNQQMGSIPPFQNFAFLPQEGQDTEISHFCQPGVVEATSYRHGSEYPHPDSTHGMKAVLLVHYVKIIWVQA